jgi:carboxypeptidase Taq
MEQKLSELKRRLQEVSDLQSINSLLFWDQSTYMPPGGAAARARQTATLGRVAHEAFIDPAIGRLLDVLRAYEESLPYDSDDAALIRITRRDYERAVRVPAEFVARFSEQSAKSYEAWSHARPANDFAAVRPFLEKTLDLSRELAGFFPGYEHIADPLIDYSDFGMKASFIRQLFAELRERLVPIVQAIVAQPPADDSLLFQRFSPARQLAFGRQVVKRFGFDFQRGREDMAPHPFTTEFSIDDVRITTRVRRDHFGDALFSTMHEAGHGMYEQSSRRELEATPLAGGTSSAVHESQSRLWENLVGRSRGFWNYFYPQLQGAFPRQLGSVPVEAFYRAVNKVEPSLIRTDADEVTYNLHVMIRFDFELLMLEGKLAIADLPGAWNERYRTDIGVVAPDHHDGVLQDVHWYGGGIGGAFQGYTLGNILNAQFYAAALAAHPTIPAQTERGEFDTLFNWLRENIWQHGRKFTTNELAERVTGGPISIEPYIKYLRGKYSELYSLPADDTGSGRS